MSTIQSNISSNKGTGGFRGKTPYTTKSGALLRNLLHMPQSVRIVLVALVMGVLTGAAAALLKALIAFFTRLTLGEHINLAEPDLKILIWPLAGILLTSIYQRYLARCDVSDSTMVIRRTLESKNWMLPISMIFNPIIGCSLTMGFGASAGSEGPTALSGAAIGSNVGRWFGLPPDWLRLLVGIGGGAGIAAIFKSPVGGVLFTLEVLQMPTTTLSVIALVIACIFSATTVYLLSGFTFDILFLHNTPFDPAMTGWVALLGLFCGLYCIYYNFTKSRSAQMFKRISNPWVASLATGVMLSAGVFMFPTLFGEGFRVITGLVNSAEVSFGGAGAFAGFKGQTWIIVCMTGVLLLKGILVSASNSGGGVAGDFVPTFFAGAVAGYLFATLCNLWFGVHLQPWFFALAGMGAVMAGTVHAPLMSLFLICETTNSYAYLFPYLLVISISYATVKLLTPKSWDSTTDHDDLMSLLNDKLPGNNE